MHILKLTIPEELKKLAKEQEKTIPKTINNSILSGKGIYIGLLGELCFIEVFKNIIDVKQDNTYEYDIIAKGESKDIYLEVKTKTCAGEPKDFYECSVADANLTQKCDMYIFIRITKDFKTAYILGSMTKSHFLKVSREMKKGDGAGNMKQGAIVQDCHNVFIHELKSLYYPNISYGDNVEVIELQT